jgi:hypothetical protein
LLGIIHTYNSFGKPLFGRSQSYDINLQRNK